MNAILHNLSPVRQTAIISAIAVLLSFTFTGSLYLLFFGMDDRFWKALSMAIIIPWGITIPLGLYTSRQRFKLIELANRLKEAQKKLRRTNKALELRANFDGMTGLLNRDSFFGRVDKLRTDQNSNVLMLIDVDHFKDINDNFGHPVGDQALKMLGKIFRNVLRKNDLIGRIGGEEFGVFLPETSVPEGQIIGEMLRYEIENMIFEPSRNMRHVITVSIGVTGIDPHQARSVLMENADAALFSAKRSGRNRVVMFEPGMRASPVPGREKPRAANFIMSTSNLRPRGI